MARDWKDGPRKRLKLKKNVKENDHFSGSLDRATFCPKAQCKTRKFCLSPPRKNTIRNTVRAAHMETKQK